MDREVLARAFDPFFTTKPVGQGTGLGLSMTYGFVKQSNGQIDIDSAPGRGTTVRLYLPRQDAAAPKPVNRAPQAKPTQGAGETVLLVEDDPSIRLLITEVLKELGYASVEAPDGQAALALLESNTRLDLMVTDVGLPGINGRQLAEMARERRPDLKILFLTGYAEHAMARSEFLAPGMGDNDEAVRNCRAGGQDQEHDRDGVLVSTDGFELSELELDALTEVVNIGISRASTSLRDMVGEQVFLSVPSVAITSPSQAAELLVQRESRLLVAVRQGFQGEFSGSALLIFPERNSLELVRAVARGDLSLEDILELEQEALAEIGNVILNGCMATIANLLDRRLIISLPEVLTGSAADLFNKTPSLLQDVVLFIHIDFSVKGRELSGYLAMVMDVPSLEALKLLVNEFIRRSAG